jgi:hypothetical protein
MSGALPLPPDEQTVAAYLGNQLPGPQAEAFEIYCLDHPEFARKVELDLSIKRGLREIGVGNPAPPAAVRQWPRWAMAAGLAAVVGCGLLLGWSHGHTGLVAYRDASEIPLPLRAGVQVSVTFLRLRGSEAPHRVVVPRHTGVLELKIYPDTASGQNGYSANIVRDTLVGTRSVALKQLRTDPEGFLELYMPLSEVVGHTLDITLASDAANAATPMPAFRLQVVAAAE